MIQCLRNIMVIAITTFAERYDDDSIVGEWLFSMNHTINIQRYNGVFIGDVNKQLYKIHNHVDRFTQLITFAEQLLTKCTPTKYLLIVDSLKNRCGENLISLDVTVIRQPSIVTMYPSCLFATKGKVGNKMLNDYYFPRIKSI